MDPQALILILAFVTLLIIGMPVAFALGISTFLAVLSIGTLPAPLQVSRTMATGIDSFPLLAIPFFVVAGELMSGGGMARRLLILAEGMVGRFRGGLAYVNTISCMMFGAISGSAAAAVSSIGGIMIPQMERAGYKREFGVAVTACSATTGLVIPPSNIMIVYAVVAQNVSIAAIFLAGFIPGAIMGTALMAASFFVLVRRPIAAPAPAAAAAPVPAASDATLSYATPGAVSEPSFLRKAIGALPSLILIIIVLGGILGGAFSATEAAAIAVAYAFILGVLIYRELPMSALPELLLRSAKTTGVVFLLIAASQAMAWILTRQQIPQAVADAMLSLSRSPIVLLLIINLTLLIVGTFMDMTPAVLIFTPIFLPVAVGLGMDPTHFGIVLIMNLCIGLCTPPVGTCLFIACGVGKTRIESASKAMIPFWIAMIVSLLLVTYVPWFATFLPRIAGWM
ncbi:MAG TPA: TRAP transporter large permease [Tepidisphaeraceae bacterium]|nr:TRAP transporter large permease [Tepidisphaeraceae bacterium]